VIIILHDGVATGKLFSAGVGRKTDDRRMVPSMIFKKDDGAR